MDTSTKYLVPEVAAELSNMELRAKLVVEGFITGLHRSPYRGFSVEFAEHRQYMPGDDLRFMDWKILGRTDKYYIKQYEEETNLRSYIMLDVSKSMDFASQKQTEDNKKKSFLSKFTGKKDNTPSSKYITKLQYGSYLAASLSYLMLLQRDAVSLTTYDTSIKSYVPPRATDRNMRMILHELDKVKSEGQTGTAECLGEIAAKVKKRGLVIIISDLFDEQEKVLNAVRHFSYMKNEVIIFQVLDPVEMNFLEGNPVTLKDVETGEEMYSQPFAIKAAYKEAVKEFNEKYKKEFTAAGVDFVTLSTETPFGKALTSYLARRKRLI